MKSHISYLSEGFGCKVPHTCEKAYCCIVFGHCEISWWLNLYIHKNVVSLVCHCDRNDFLPWMCITIACSSSLSHSIYFVSSQVCSYNTWKQCTRWFLYSCGWRSCSSSWRKWLRCWQPTPGFSNHQPVPLSWSDCTGGEYALQHCLWHWQLWIPILVHWLPAVCSVNSPIYLSVCSS